MVKYAGIERLLRSLIPITNKSMKYTPPIVNKAMNYTTPIVNKVMNYANRLTNKPHVIAGLAAGPAFMAGSMYSDPETHKHVERIAQRLREIIRDNPMRRIYNSVVSQLTPQSQRPITPSIPPLPETYSPIMPPLPKIHLFTPEATNNWKFTDTLYPYQ